MPCSAASSYWSGLSESSLWIAELAVRRAADHVGEGAAAVDPELPAAALHARHELNSLLPDPAEHRRRAGGFIAETARQTQGMSATQGIIRTTVACGGRGKPLAGLARAGLDHQPERASGPRGRKEGVGGIWGKILGGAAGLAIGGPIGAIIGAVAGHAYDSYREQEKRARLAAPGSAAGHGRSLAAQRPASGPERWARTSRGGWQEPPPIFADPTETRRIAFATAVIVLGAKLAKVDGVVTRDEMRAFKRVFRIDDGEVGDVARIYNQAKASAQGFEPYARQIAALFGHDPFLLEELLNGLFEVARADGELNPAEVDFLRRVAAIFGFDVAAFEMIRARFSATARNLSGADDAYAVLGLTRSASDDEIKQTYRNLVREHHPDRLVAKGMPEEFVERANKTLAAINAAYDRIEKERNSQVMKIERITADWLHVPIPRGEAAHDRLRPHRGVRFDARPGRDRRRPHRLRRGQGRGRQRRHQRRADQLHRAGVGALAASARTRATSRGCGT